MLVVARRRQHWGVTDEEVVGSLPGDDLIPAARLDSIHAITIRAPAQQVWPWLAQMGDEGRAACTAPTSSSGARRPAQHQRAGSRNPADTSDSRSVPVLR
jgi:hypothetical protein